MFTRRDFLRRSLKGASLLAVGSVVPEFVARTARAAGPGEERALVVVELTGGNDGLNTVIPYADDLYHKARPTLRHTARQVLRLSDHVGLHPSLDGLWELFNNEQLAVVQGVGYPNPDRSHFESMDVWQTADPGRRTQSGWLARTVPALLNRGRDIPAFHIGEDRLPVALRGAPGGVVSLNDPDSFSLDLGPDEQRRHARRKLLDDLTAGKGPEDDDDLTAFVRRRQLQTYASIGKIREALQEESPDTEPAAPFPVPRVLIPGRSAGAGSLGDRLGLIARLIAKGFGARVYYVALDGFDTHSEQGQAHAELLAELGNAVRRFFRSLQESGDAGRVALMTFSEFGRRVHENGSRGTDHGAASCLFVAGPKVKHGLVGDHPRLDDLADGDLNFAIDFRRVYATLLDGWLGVDSAAVLGGRFEHLPLLK